MHSLFEQSDYLTSPFEAFLFDSKIGTYPVSSHWHYFCEVLYFIKGNAQIMCDGHKYNVKEHDFVFFHPQSVHSIFGEENVIYYVMKFDISLLKSTGSHMTSFQKIFISAINDKAAPIVISDQDFQEYKLEAAFKNCIKELNQKKYGYDLCVQAELTSLLTQILRVWRKKGFKTDNTINNISVTNPFYSVVEYINANLNQAIRVEDLADMCGMSYSYFAKQFHQIYGRSCKEYISFMRINKVKDMLLLTDYDLTYICQETGFADCSHLIRTFKKFEGITPKQYRMKG